MSGSFHATGGLGEWTGGLAGPVLPAPLSTTILDELTLVDDPARRGAQLYRQVLALDLVRRDPGLLVQEALDRSQVPEPGELDPSATAAYLGGLLHHARSVAGEAPAAPRLSGPQVVDDQTFGPYQSGIAVLPDNRLPAVSAEAPQQWAWLGGWQVCGPFGVYDQDASVHLPALLPIPGTSYARERVFWIESDLETRTDHARWVPAGGQDALVAVPMEEHTSSGALPYLCWYATTTVHSALAQEVWLAAEVAGAVLLWCNDEPVWVSDQNHVAPRPSLFRLPLRAGDNRLLLRVASTAESNRHFAGIDWFEGYGHRVNGRVDFTHAILHLATAGAPAQSTTAHSGQRHTAQQGWRGDGTGRNPTAQPPLAWDLDKDLNVRWRQPAAGGRSDLVHADGTLFLAAAPHHLICLDADSGQELWRRSVDRLRLDGNTAFAALGADPLDAYATALAQATTDKALLAPYAGLAKWLKEQSTGVVHAAATCPVVADGTVWVQFGTGVAACFALDGTVRWERATGAAWNHAEQGQSLLVDGLFIIQVGGDELLALDAATGAERWRRGALPRRTTCLYDRSGSLGNGTVCLHLEHGDLRRSVLVTGEGAVLAADDGTILHRDLFRIEANRSAPEADGDTVYAASVIGEQAIRLWLDSDGRVNTRTLWHAPHGCGRGLAKTVTQWGPGHWPEGPLLDDGHLHLLRVDHGHVPQHVPCPWLQLDRRTLANGSPLRRHRAVLREATDEAVPLVKAGTFLLACDGGDPMAGFGGVTSHGTLAVLDCTAESTWVLARNRIGRMRATPLPVGDRLYLRSYDETVCLQVRDEPGRRYQEEALASTLFDEIPPRTPPPPVLAPATDPVLDQGERPVSRLCNEQVPTAWLTLGPLPVAKAGEDPLAALGGQAAARPVAGTTVAAAGKELAFVPLTAAGKLDVLAAAGGTTPATVYFHAVIDNPKAGFFRFRNVGKGVQAWLGGLPVVDGDHVRLGLGRYPLLIRVDLGKLPPFAQKGGIAIAPDLVSVADPVGDYHQWLELVTRSRHRLERIVTERPDSAWAGKARLLLEQLNRQP